MKGNKVTKFIKRKSLDRDEKILLISSTKQTGPGVLLLAVTGQQTRTKANNNKCGDLKNNEHEMNTDNDLNTRPLSDKGPVNEVVNLPKLHQSNKSLDDSASTRDNGTIRRPYEGEIGLRPLVIQAFNRNKCEHDDKTNSEPTDQTHLQLEDAEIDSESAKAKREYIQSTKNDAISSFPPVEEHEIDKHRHMNEEAEKSNTSKAPPNRYQGYLKRLSLERKAINDQKTKEMKLQKRKVLKRTQTKARFMKEFKDDVFDEKPPTPPKAKETDAKPMKLILGFRYSYAVEQYYRGQMKHLGSELSFRSDELDNAREEVLNGWLVKSLGPNVLNLRARTLPSCNPVEIRLRRQQARIRNLTRSRSLNRAWSRESGLSRAALKSQDSVSKLQSIEEGRESRQSNQSLKDKRVVISQKVEVMGTGQQNDRSTMTVLPPIYSTEKVYSGVPKIKKSISLKLPVIGAEE